MYEQAVLLSIQPKWCEKIASGEKTVEVRKTRPKIETPFKCYIYKTKKRILRDVAQKGDELYGTCGQVADKTEIVSCSDFDGGKIMGEFVCDKICDIVSVNPLPWGGALDYGFDFDFRKTCLSVSEFKDYLDGKDGYGWYISDLKIYDKPKELSEFFRHCNKNANCAYCKRARFNGGNCNGRLSRPPQSWCYVSV